MKVIQVRPTEAPVVRTCGPPEEMYELMGTRRIEWAPYPRPHTVFQLIVNEVGAYTATAYNRWGIVGTFLVIRRCSSDGKSLSLTDGQIDEVLQDLETTDGYLEPDCPVMNLFREPFRIHGVPPAGWVPQKGMWFGG